jgi:hypothetical protein
VAAFPSKGWSAPRPQFARQRVTISPQLAETGPRFAEGLFPRPWDKTASRTAVSAAATDLSGAASAQPRRSLLRLVLRNHTSPEPNARLSVATLLVEGATSSGAVRVRARLGTPRDHALIAPLALNGLRVSEALGADVTDLDVERSQRVLRSVLRAASTSRPRNDLISSRDERIETVDCGTSRFDRVIADRIDRLLGCELVRLG